MTIIANIVYQKTVAEGTGALGLSAVPGYRSFYAAFGTGGSDMFFYALRHTALDEWEVGTGHLSDATTLMRDTVIASSNAGAAVNFSAGDKDVVNDIPAERQLPLPATPETGDLLRYDGSRWQSLPRGSDGQMLKSGSDNIAWVTPAVADINGLQTLLDGKSSTGHAHGTAEITGLAAALTEKADAAHSHSMTDVTGLSAGLAGKADAAHSHAIADVTGLAAALSGMADSAHYHVVSDITGLQSALNGKADASHTHTASAITDLSETLSAYAPAARLVTGTGSLTGGGDLSADRSLQLAGDDASPGNGKYYGTNNSGDKGFYPLPGGADAADVSIDTAAHTLIKGANVAAALANADAALRQGGFDPAHFACCHNLMGSLNGSIFTPGVTGSGANAATVDTDYLRNLDAHGVIRLSTGTAATGSAFRSLGGVPIVVHDTGKTLRLVSRIQLDTLIAAGSQEFYVWGGITLSTAANTSIDTTVGVYWVYDKTAASWQLRRRLAATTDSVDTGVTVAADTWYEMELAITGSSTESAVDMQLSINGAAVASLTHLPGYLTFNAVSAAIQKKLGAGARYLYVDYEGLFMGRSA